MNRKRHLLLTLLALSALLIGCTSDDEGTPASNPAVLPDTAVSATITGPNINLSDDDIEAAFARQVAIGEAFAPSLIGHPRADAETALNASGQNWRPVEIDGRSLPITEDWNPGRLNVTFARGRLTQIDVEGGKTFP